MGIQNIRKPQKERKHRQKAYQCNTCQNLDVDDVSDKLFCHCGFFPRCGDAEGCKQAYIPIEGRGRIGVHR